MNQFIHLIHWMMTSNVLIPSPDSLLSISNELIHSLDSLRQSWTNQFPDLIHCDNLNESISLPDSLGQCQRNQSINLIHCGAHYLNTPGDYTVQFTSIWFTSIVFSSAKKKKHLKTKSRHRGMINLVPHYSKFTRKKSTFRKGMKHPGCLESTGTLVDRKKAKGKNI